MKPNWKTAGYKSAEDAMCQAVADVFKQYPDAALIYKGVPMIMKANRKKR